MVKWKCEIIFLIFAILSVLSFAPSEAQDTNLRLPRAVRPLHYEIKLETAVHEGGIRDYEGSVKIDLSVVETTNQVVLHHRDLSITNVQLFYNQTGIEIDISSTEYNNETEFFTITTSSELTVSSILSLEIQFNGKLQTGTAGFYRSQYQVPGESTPRYLAATQFEPTRARSAFPCFDEPEFRSFFKLFITHGLNYTAISNMIGTYEPSGSSATTEFEVTTVTMPTYLLAFVVSDLDYVSNDLQDPLAQRVYATKELVDLTKTALYYSEVFLEILEDFVNFPYQLPKLYSASLPDHGSAMENYGLILYKEQYLAIERVPHPREMYDLVGTITHELTHQFFGNLVTCKWWDQIWLNEGFATWGEFLLPEYLGITEDHQFHHLFNIRKTQNAFRHDSRQSTRPMSFPTYTNAEISARFDNIAYDKSGAVIRMFQYVTGDVKFQASLHRYLSDNEHTSITSDELLSAFETEVGNSLGFDFTAAFRSWENQKGYPIINVVHDTDHFKITQKRYLSGFEVIEPADEDAKWFIPLSFTTAVAPDFSNGEFTDYFRLDDDEKTISTTGLASSQWYIFNIQQHGYYRVNYDITNWQNIIRVLNSPDYTQIHVLNRAQLVDDALTLAFDGNLSYDIALGVVSYLHREVEYFPWYSAVMAFDKIEALLRGSSLHEEFKTFVRFLIQKMYQYYGVENDFNTDTIITQFARELAIEWACRTGDKKCIDNSVQQLQAGNISAPLQIVFYCNGLKESDNSVAFDELVTQMHNASFQTERLRIVDGLLCSKNAEALKGFLASMLEPEVTFYRAHERRIAFNSLVARNMNGLKILVEFIEGNYEGLKTTMGVSFIEGLFVAASARIADSTDAELLLGSINLHRSELSEKTVADVTNNIENNKMWVQSEQFSALQSKIRQLNNDVWRLPKTSIPSHYEIHLDVRNVQNGDLPYSGEVKIDAEIVEATDNIVIHSKDQEFQEIEVRDTTTSAIIPISMRVVQVETDQITLFLDQTLAVGTKVQIHAKYTTELLTEIDGLYQDSYIESDGFTTKYLATTQFQAVEARRVFPSYDEPALKAVFTVSITHDASYHAVANMPINSQVNNTDGTVTTHFDATPPMSSYLNAFLISDFDVLTNELTKQPDETLQGIYTRPGQSQKAQYGLDNSVEILNALEDFVNVKFDLPKLDSGAIPGKGGGMENWGLVLYREAALMYEEDISHSLMQRGVRLISHEIVHMFFGDLVTGEWWNYLWLNEGFATDLMYSLLDHLHPDWHMKEFFSRNIMIPYAFATDATDSTRTMSSELITTSDINNSFDDIAYDKAACVLRMAGYLLGDELWRQGLNLYLETNKYKAVNSQHFVDAIVSTLNDAGMSEIPFDAAFRTWENQEGFPLVHAVYDSQQEAFVLTQERFFEKKRTDGVDMTKWFIAVNYATQSDYDFDDLTVTYIMKEFVDETLIPITGFNTSQWLILNKQQIGYYRVMYEPANYKALIDFLHTDNFEVIHVVNRMHLIDDAFTLAHGGYLDYQVPYDIVTYLLNDNNFFTWDTFMDNVNRLYEIFGSKDAVLNRLIYNLSRNFYAQYKLIGDSIPNETMPVRYGRELAYFIACNAGNEDCLADTRVLGKLDASGVKAIPRGLEDPILCNYFNQESIQDEWMSVWDRMNKLQQNMDYTLKTNLINALACTNNEEFLYEHLESSLRSAVNYTQADRRNVFNAVLKNENGLEAIFKLLNTHGESNTPVERFGWSWQRILLNIADSIHTDAERTKYLAFLDNFVHVDVTTDLLERSRDASNANLNAQILPENIIQIDLVRGILERVFGETTSTTTTEEPITTTEEPTTTTEEPIITTPGAGTALRVSLLLMTILVAVTLKF